MTGLKGMQPRRGEIIRPLLFATRTELETYARDHELSFRMDSSNNDLSYRRNRIRLEGEVADPSNPPSGCYFHPRCRYTQGICSQETPHLRELSPGHFVSCHLAEELELGGASMMEA